MAQYLVLAPVSADAEEEWLKIGVTRHTQQPPDLDGAENAYRQALRLDPVNVRAGNNLAVVLAMRGNLNAALLAFERTALYGEPRNHDGTYALGTVYANYALCCMDADRPADGLAAAERAVFLCPGGDALSQEETAGYRIALLACATAVAQCGDAPAALPYYDRLLKSDPDHQHAMAAACFCQTLVDSSAADLLARRKVWYEGHRFRGDKKPHPNPKNPDRVLRVGYVGGDFKRHSAAMLFGAVLLHHSDAVEPYFYSCLPADPVNDPMTKRFALAAGWDGKSHEIIGKNPDGRDVAVGPSAPRWRNVCTQAYADDARFEELIRSDRIDVLVDLAAHTAGNRLAVFLRKPAPVQVTAWGFAHGTGCPEVDYFLADPVMIPPDERGHYAEEIIDIPCAVGYEPPADYGLKGTSAAPFLKNDFITFGCYARYEKYSLQCLETLAEILARVPNSRLEFKDAAFSRPDAAKRVLNETRKKGVAETRLLFSQGTDHRDHLMTYQHCDLFLSPFPHGPGTVGMEVLYMGVPAVTLLGNQPAGRTFASVLQTIGRGDWVARSRGEYVDKAVALANDRRVLRDARKTLRRELLDSPCVKGYAAAVEKVYRDLWTRYCKGD